jgi:endonuclease/exonuclease/phosphatase family metal-dependent hydrolase
MNRYTIGMISTLLVCGGCVPGQESAPRQTPARTLRILAYNVQLLPLEQLNKRPDDVYRTAVLGRRLAGYDVLGLSEVYQPQRRTELVDALRSAWQSEFHVATAPDWERTPWGLDGGLVLMSKLPISASHWRAFGNGSSPLEHGLQADGFSNKGVLHVRLRREAAADDRAELDLFLTHLESRESTRRDEQYAMLAEFMAEHVADDRPIMLLGDLNTHGSRKAMDDANSQYRRLLGLLEKVRAKWLDVGATIDEAQWGTMPADEVERANRIDYVFIANSLDGDELRVRSTHVERFADPRVKFLSDHAAVETTLEWQSR